MAEYQVHWAGLRQTWLVAAAVLILAALTPLPSRAEPVADQWQWGATVYLWLPTLEGDTSFPPNGGGPSIDVSADILDSLNFVFMGAFEGRKGPWALATDVIYLDLGNSSDATRDFGIGRIDIPASVSADLRLDVEGWVWTVLGSYEVLRQDNFTMDALAGTRVLNLREDLHWAFNGDISSLPLPGRTGAGHEEATQWDAIVGLKGRATFGAERSWYIPYYVDIGAGDSDLTWQAMLGLGYSFGSIGVTGVWRHLEYDIGNDSQIQGIKFDGPALGITFRF